MVPVKSGPGFSKRLLYVQHLQCTWSFFRTRVSASTFRVASRTVRNEHRKRFSDGNCSDAAVSLAQKSCPTLTSPKENLPDVHQSFCSNCINRQTVGAFLSLAASWPFLAQIQSDRVAATAARSRLQGSLCASLSVELAGRIPMRSVDAIDVGSLEDLTATSSSISMSDVAGQDGV